MVIGELKRFETKQNIYICNILSNSPSRGSINDKNAVYYSVYHSMYYSVF